MLFRLGLFHKEKIQDPAVRAEFEQLVAAIQKQSGKTIPTSNLSGSTFAIFTSDPAVPTNDTAWLFRDGGSPENISLRVRVFGVTYDIPLFTLP